MTHKAQNTKTNTNADINTNTKANKSTNKDTIAYFHRPNFWMVICGRQHLAVQLTNTFDVEIKLR